MKDRMPPCLIYPDRVCYNICLQREYAEQYIGDLSKRHHLSFEEAAKRISNLKESEIEIYRNLNKFWLNEVSDDPHCYHDPE